MHLSPFHAVVPMSLLCWAAQASCDFSKVIARVEQRRQDAQLEHAAILLGNRRGVLLKQYLGEPGWDDATRVPVASASKLLAGVRVVQAVDRGLLDLDVPVSVYLAEFTGIKGSMTMRQMFSHTAGYGNDSLNPVLGSSNVTLVQAVSYIACCIDPVFPPPGSYFAYGGISMHVGGQVVATRSQQDWEVGWKAGVGVPLGVTSIDWQGLGATSNYRISGGAQTNLPDYAKVLSMLLAQGVGNGQRVLSPAAVNTLARDQTGAATLAYSPPGANGSSAYGIGAWIESISASADAPIISSIGAFGFAPWVDFERSYFGVLMVEDHGQSTQTPGERSHDALQDIASLMRGEYSTDCPLIALDDAIFRSGVDGF